MVRNNINIANAKIIFRNFSGKEGKFNPAGNRNFCVLFDPDTAQILVKEGWNIRYLQPKDNEDVPQAYLQIKVSYDKNPPKIIIISSRGKTILNESTVNILDWAEIKEVDLTIKPYNWSVNGKAGVKGYLKTMYVTIEEDEFEQKYQDVPDSAHDMIGGCGNCETCDGTCGCHHD